jgi:hypothetical protein
MTARINYYQHSMELTTLGAQVVGPPYEVICVELEVIGQREGHEHIAAVKTRDPDGGETRWTADQVIAAVGDGLQFLVAEDEGAGEIVLEPAVCPQCSANTLVVDPREARPPMCD